MIILLVLIAWVLLSAPVALFIAACIREGQR